MGQKIDATVAAAKLTCRGDETVPEPALQLQTTKLTTLLLTSQQQHLLATQKAS